MSEEPHAAQTAAMLTMLPAARRVTEVHLSTGISKEGVPAPAGTDATLYKRDVDDAICTARR